MQTKSRTAAALVGRYSQAMPAIHEICLAHLGVPPAGSQSAARDSASRGENGDHVTSSYSGIVSYLDGFEGALDSLHLGCGHRLAGNPCGAEIDCCGGGRRGHGGGTAAHERERAARGEGGEAEGCVGQADDGNHAGSRELRPPHHHLFLNPAEIHLYAPAEPNAAWRPPFFLTAAGERSVWERVVGARLHEWARG